MEYVLTALFTALFFVMQLYLYRLKSYYFFAIIFLIKYQVSELKVMTVYTVMMFVLAILFMIVGIMVYAGKTELIHEYNRKNVEDETGYAKAMGKALLGIAFSSLVSGIISLIGKSSIFSYISVAVLIFGLLVSCVFIFRVQKKFNGGLF